MRFVSSLVVASVTILVAACSGATPTPSPGAPSGTAAPTTDATGAPTAGAIRIDVRLTDSFRIEPSPIRVPVGVPVTFVVTNTGVLEHEFFVGDEHAQQEHEREMAGMGGMAHDEEMGIGVKAGETKELTVTFQAPGSTLAGCHVPGHYPAGMKATIEIG